MNLDYGFDFADTPINSTTDNNGITANLDTHSQDWGFLQPQVNTGSTYLWAGAVWSPSLGIFCACTGGTSQLAVL